MPRFISRWALAHGSASENRTLARTGLSSKHHPFCRSEAPSYGAGDVPVAGHDKSAADFVPAAAAAGLGAATEMVYNNEIVKAGSLWKASSLPTSRPGKEALNGFKKQEAI